MRGLSKNDHQRRAFGKMRHPLFLKDESSGQAWLPALAIILQYVQTVVEVG